MSIQVTACLNPFSGERKEFSFEQGITINEIIRNLDALNAVNTGWRVMIDDEIITDFERVPEEGQRVYIKLVPEGDNNKDSGAGMKTAGGLLTVVGAILAFTPASALGFCLIGCGVGMFAGGVVLYNTDIPSLSDREKPEQDPSIRGSRNQMRPYGKVPVLLGKRRIYADACANPYTWVDSEGAIWLHQLFCVAQKDVQIDTSTLKIDETLLKDYSATGDISRVLDQSNPDPLIQMKISYGDSTPPLYDKCVHEIQLNTVLKHQTEDEQDGSLIRTTPAKTTKINVDVFFYNGLGKYNDEGNVVSTSVELKAEYKKSTEPDSAYQLLGYFSEGSNTISGSELKTKRYAITKDNLTADSYTVKISRVTADSTDIKIIDTVYVGSIRAANNDTPVRSARCQQVTLIGLKIKASEKLNNIVEQLNFVAQSKMPVYNSQSHQWTNALTSNPASAAMYAMQGEVAQQRLSNSDIDLDSFAALYSWCANHDYECNAYITDDITINDLLSSIASTCRAEILRMNGKITVIQDIAKDSFVQLFTPRNSHDYKETMALADIPDVLKMGIVDKTNGYAENEVPVYNTPSGNPVSGVEPQTSQSVPLWGVTDSVQARKLAMYNYAVSKHRFTVIKFSCDFEYLMCRKGDWIKYAGDIALAGLKQGRIEAVDGQKLILDEQVTMESGKTYAVRIRKSDGSAVLCNVQTVIGTSNEITILGQVPSGVEGCLFAFGITGNETIDLIVTDIQCGENLSADLTCVEYAPEIFGVDDPGFVLPDFENKLSDVDSVVDPGDVDGWRTFATYNDSDSQPATPTGGGTYGSWHLQQTENAKWISTKTAASIYEGEWSAPMPTGKKVMDVLVPEGEITEPDNVTGVTAIARQNEIVIQWNLNADDGLHNSIANYIVQVSKDSGNTWNTGNQVTGNSTSYIFNRDTNADGFPERETFATWRVRVTAVNIYGKNSTPTVQPIDRSSYGTWIPAVPSLSKIPDESGIKFEWPSPTGVNGRTLYGSNQYELTVSYDGTDRPVITTSELNTVYTFDRDSQADGYPEAVHDEGHTGLDLFSFKLKVINESGNFRQSNAQSFSSAETENYGTWIPVASSFIKRAAVEYGIDYEWTPATADGNIQLYGSNTYKLKVYCGNSLRATIEKGTLSAIYSFDRATDGYPEKQGVTGAAHTLDEYTATIEVINVSGNHATSQPAATIDTTYLGWKPDVPAITTRSSGRALTINPVNSEQRYGKIRYHYLINNLEKDGNNYYLPTPTADYLASEDNYKDGTCPDIPFVADSPYTQTMPLKGQNATSYKLCSWEGASTQDEYDEAEKKSIVYSSTDPSTGHSATTRTMNINGEEQTVKYWYDSTNSIHYASFETSMPSASDTSYRFKVQALNSVADNIASAYSEPVSVTAKATAAFDVVNGAITANALAPDAVTTEKIAAGNITAEKIFVRALAAISANLGRITDGELVGNENNYWYLSDEYDDNHQLVHHAGDFRVGGATGSDYIKCTTQNGTTFNIEIHASKFELTAVGTVIHGEFFVCDAGQALDANGRPTDYYAKITKSAIEMKKPVTISNNLSVSGSFSITDATKRQNATNELINSLSEDTSDPVDNDYYVAQYAGGESTTKTYHRRPIKALWNYIKGKISSVLGLTASSYGGNAASADYTRQGAYCDTASATQAKVANMRVFSPIGGATFLITFTNSNSYNGTITLNVNGTGAKNIWINGAVSSSSNKTLSAGTYICYYESGVYKIDTSWCVPYARRASTSDRSSVVSGVYTNSGGQQSPQYVGKGNVRFNMMNTSINGDSTYKDFLLMDCYTGFDVGGATAFGISRTALKAFIMRSAAGTSPNRPTSWAESAELIHSGNIANQTVKRATDNYGIIEVTGASNGVIQTKGKPVYNTINILYNPSALSSGIAGYRSSSSYNKKINIDGKLFNIVLNSTTEGMSSLPAGYKDFYIDYYNSFVEFYPTQGTSDKVCNWFMSQGLIDKLKADKVDLPTMHASLNVILDYNFTTTSGYIIYANGLKIQWGIIDKGSNLSAGGEWIPTIDSSKGFLSYTSASSYKVFLTNKGTNAGTEVVLYSQAAASFSFYLYNRNSSTTMKTPSMQWFTIGY